MAEVAARLREHLSAAGGHGALPLCAAPGTDPLPGYRRLAEVLNEPKDVRREHGVAGREEDVRPA